jgi:hypothetical protein
MLENGHASEVLAWWGAGLSSVLGLIKIYEFWRDRTRIDIGAGSTSSEDIGNSIQIRNLSSRPIILSHWELLYVSGRWPRRTYQSFSSAEYDFGDHRLEPHGTHTLHFAEDEYFDAGRTALNGRRIFIRLYFAGRRPILRLAYGA